MALFLGSREGEKTRLMAGDVLFWEKSSNAGSLFSFTRGVTPLFENSLSATGDNKYLITGIQKAHAAHAIMCMIADALGLKLKEVERSNISLCCRLVDPNSN